MKKNNRLLFAFAIVAAAQLFVPAWMIIGHERTLATGEVFKFRTRPVDPVDYFRGRFVRIDLEPSVVRTEDPNLWTKPTKAYAVLTKDPDGYAVVSGLQSHPPRGQAAVEVMSGWTSSDDGEVMITWTNLQRYYMNEAKAPAAEAAYRKHSRDAVDSCHVTVRVRGSHAVLEQLFIDDIPIEEWLERKEDS